MLAAYFKKLWYILLCGLLISCRPNRKIHTSFFYWKTVYSSTSTQNKYLKQLHVHKLYMRMMDVDMAENGTGPVPISPVTFQEHLPDSTALVPVVFIVNDVFKNTPPAQLSSLAAKIVRFVQGKAKQAGKTDFEELLIDCDWTQTTRQSYFGLLQQLRRIPALKGKIIAASLRLHQLKNQNGSGIPPVNRVMLMCYNMGNLRRYGYQNSILEQSELEKYLGSNLSAYPMPVDVGLPLFSWAVAFRNRQYIGIARRINQEELNDAKSFIITGHNMYVAQTDLPRYGLLKADEVRWEAINPDNLNTAARYIARYLKSGTADVIYFHLDDAVLKPYTYETLEKTADLLR